MFSRSHAPSPRRLQMTQESRGIGGAWAGGADGMTITNTVLQQLPVSRRISVLCLPCPHQLIQHSRTFYPLAAVFISSRYIKIIQRILMHACCSLDYNQKYVVIYSKSPELIDLVQGNHQTTSWERTVICFENF